MEALEYNEETITHEDHKVFHKIWSDIQRIQEFGNKANLKLFTYLFGEDVGPHLMEVFLFKSHRNIFDFLYNRVDASVQGKIMINIYRNETLYAHC